MVEEKLQGQALKMKGEFHLEVWWEAFSRLYEVWLRCSWQLQLQFNPVAGNTRRQ